jgi:hypothetical protein
VAGEGNREHHHFALCSHRRIICTFDLNRSAYARTKVRRGFGCALRIARTDHYLFACPRPAVRQAGAFRAGTAENPDPSAHLD